ncbi:Efflux pump membrane transporter BepE [Sphingobacterium daejeonense]|nr:Efflux pump membrane transporter BepE [Sphingobacterium daejeonense]
MLIRVFKSTFPQYEVNIDVVKAKSLGVSINSLMSTIRLYFARVQASDFSRFGRQYRVYVQSDFDFRTDPESFSSIFVRNDAGKMVPINTIVTLNKIVGPETITRYNLYNAIVVNAEPAKGYSTGDAMAAIEQFAEEKLPGNIGYEWTGMSLEESQSGFSDRIDLCIKYLICLLLACCTV